MGGGWTDRTLWVGPGPDSKHHMSVCLGCCILHWEFPRPPEKGYPWSPPRHPDSGNFGVPPEPTLTSEGCNSPGQSEVPKRLDPGILAAWGSPCKKRALRAGSGMDPEGRRSCQLQAQRSCRCPTDLQRVQNQRPNPVSSQPVQVPPFRSVRHVLVQGPPPGVSSSPPPPRPPSPPRRPRGRPPARPPPSRVRSPRRHPASFRARVDRDLAGG